MVVAGVYLRRNSCWILECIRRRHVWRIRICSHRFLYLFAHLWIKTGVRFDLLNIIWSMSFIIHLIVWVASTIYRWGEIFVVTITVRKAMNPFQVFMMHVVIICLFLVPRQRHSIIYEFCSCTRRWCANRPFQTIWNSFKLSNNVIQCIININCCRTNKISLRKEQKAHKF